MLEDLIRKNRSCRRFYENHDIAMPTLKELANLARLSASTGNRQPLKYVLCCDREKNESVFKCLGWAGYLKDWPGPKEGERPSAYIVICSDDNIATNPGCDHGIAAQSIMLGARAVGLAACIIASIQKKRLKTIFNLGDHLKVLLVIALGRPKEIIELESVGEDGDIRYWRDEKSVHHVPKRNLSDIIVASFE